MYDAQNYGGGRSSGGNNYGSGSPGNKQAPGGAVGGANNKGNAPQNMPGRGLRPVTIRMLLEAQRVGEGVLTISEHEAGSVTVAGRIIETVNNADSTLQPQNTAKSHTYRITDGTGIITVKHWFDQASGAVPEEPGSFVLATGNVKIFQDRPLLTGTIRVLADLNEFTFHLLECINVHLRLTQGDRLPAGAKTKAGDHSHSTPGAPAAGGSHLNTFGTPATAAAGGAPSTMPAGVNLEQLIHRVLMSADRARGMSPAELHQRLANDGHPYTVQQVDSEMKRLSGTGFYFTMGEGRYSY